MPGSSPGITGAFCGASTSHTHTHTDFELFKQQNQFQTRLHDLAARCARGLHKSSAPFEGVGNAGCPLHPRPRVHFVLVESTRVTTSTPERPAFPHAMVLTAYVVLSPVTGLSCHRHQRIKV